jgi:hypothetical protein
MGACRLVSGSAWALRPLEVRKRNSAGGESRTFAMHSTQITSLRGFIQVVREHLDGDRLPSQRVRISSIVVGEGGNLNLGGFLAVVEVGDWRLIMCPDYYGDGLI